MFDMMKNDKKLEEKQRRAADETVVEQRMKGVTDWKGCWSRQKT